MGISQKAVDLIIAHEITNEKRYELRYRRPIWPGVQSGATIGIGYDLGHTDAKTIRADWEGKVPDAMLEAMLSCVGLVGPTDGQRATNRVKHLIDIPYALARQVFDECVMPRWEANLAKQLPNTDKLSGDCRGVLVSLVYNRGFSFRKPRQPGVQVDRYTEMRSILKHMQDRNFAAIPAEIRSMKRLWDPATAAGLLRRRDEEADLFEAGLQPAQA